RRERTGEGAPDGQLDGDDVAHDVEAVEFAVNVGGQLTHEDDQVAQVLTAVHLTPDDVVEHAVLGEQVDESLHVEDVTLGRVVRLANDGLDVGGLGGHWSLLFR